MASAEGGAATSTRPPLSAATLVGASGVVRSLRRIAPDRRRQFDAAVAGQSRWHGPPLADEIENRQVAPFGGRRPDLQTLIGPLRIGTIAVSVRNGGGLPVHCVESRLR
jgi:hypothetical protein